MKAGRGTAKARGVKADTVKVGTVAISRPDKVLFPDDGITKADLADFYQAAARRMLPHLRGRPLMLERYPDGIKGPAFMQKDVPDYFPDWVRTAELPKEDGTVTYAIAENTATLVYLAGQGCVTFHRFLSKADRPHHPDRLVFDLDPAGDDFEAVRNTAGLLHAVLDDLGLPCAAMTTGSRGLHVVVPLLRAADVDEVRGFAREVADLLVARHPDRLTTEAAKKARRGRLYLDVQRNGYAQTAVAPYTVRALPGAPVATPLAWAELDEPGMDARRWTLTTIGKRLEDEDPWAGLSRRGQSLARAAKRLETLRSENLRSAS